MNLLSMSPKHAEPPVNVEFGFLSNQLPSHLQSICNGSEDPAFGKDIGAQGVIVRLQVSTRQHLGPP
jgi:hypothetical protein